MIDSKKIKQDFPIFKKHPDLVYLDSCATSLKPQSVIDKLTEYYTNYSANVFRGIYKISEQATDEYEETRRVVGKFINANRPEEVVFTRNTTESLNLIAYALGRQIVEKDDEIVTTIMEHHSNFVPWQQLTFENNGVLKVLNTDAQGCLSGENLASLITRNTKILALTYVSNVLGTINSLKELIQSARKVNPSIMVVVDGAQAVPHLTIDVQDLDCDFFAFSSHKMLGPTGIGVLWGRYDMLSSMFPFQFGGEMIEEVAIENTSFKKPPHKFEAGTPHIAGVIALKEAIRYLESVGMDAIREHEKVLTEYGMSILQDTFGDDIRILGPSVEKRGGIIAFTLKQVHPHDIAQVLDESDVAIRAGHHCTMPLHAHLGIPASARASFHIYNDKEDVDKLVVALKKVKEVFRRS